MMIRIKGSMILSVSGGAIAIARPASGAGSPGDKFLAGRSAAAGLTERVEESFPSASSQLRDSRPGRQVGEA